jgi:hypothetical protein
VVKYLCPKSNQEIYVVIDGNPTNLADHHAWGINSNEYEVNLNTGNSGTALTHTFDLCNESQFSLTVGGDQYDRTYPDFTFATYSPYSGFYELKNEAENRLFMVGHVGGKITAPGTYNVAVVVVESGLTGTTDLDRDTDTFDATMTVSDVGYKYFTATINGSLDIGADGNGNPIIVPFTSNVYIHRGE